MIINHAKYYGIMNDNHRYPSRTGGGRGRGQRALHRARLHPVRIPLCEDRIETGPPRERT